MARKSVDCDSGIEQAALAIKTIAHPLRLKVLCVLAADELSVQEIVAYLGWSQSNISQHLAVLRSHGVLVTRKVANRVLYRIHDPRTIRIVNMMGEVFCSTVPNTQH